MPLHCFCTPKTDVMKNGLDIQHKTKISTQSQKFSSSIVRMNSGWIWHYFIWLNLIHLSCAFPWLFMPIQSKHPAKWETRVLSRLYTGGNTAVRWRIFIRSSINEDMEKFQKIYIWVVCYAILCNFILFCLELACRVSFSLFPSYDHPKLNHYDLKLPIPGN